MSSVVISLRNAYAYLQDQLEVFGIDEPDLTTTLVQQLAACVVNYNQPDTMPRQRLSPIYEQIAQLTGCHIDRAAAICRHADDLIATEIVRFIPDFGGLHYRGIVSHALSLNHDVRIYFKDVAAGTPPPAA